MYEWCTGCSRWHDPQTGRGCYCATTIARRLTAHGLTVVEVMDESTDGRLYDVA